MSNQINRKVITLVLLGVMGVAPALAYAHNGKENKGRNNKRHEDTSCIRAWGHLFAPGHIKNWGSVEISDDCVRPFGIAKKLRLAHRDDDKATTTPDTTAPTINNVSVNASTTTAVIVWRTNERSNSTVFWNTSANFDIASSTTASTTRNALVRTHIVPLENLTASTTYYFVVRSKDASGNASTSAESSFTTLIGVN